MTIKPLQHKFALLTIIYLLFITTTFSYFFFNHTLKLSGEICSNRPGARKCGDIFNFQWNITYNNASTQYHPPINHDKLHDDIDTVVIPAVDLAFWNRDTGKFLGSRELIVDPKTRSTDILTMNFKTALSDATSVLYFTLLAYVEGAPSDDLPYKYTQVLSGEIVTPDAIQYPTIEDNPFGPYSTQEQQLYIQQDLYDEYDIDTEFIQTHQYQLQQRQQQLQQQPQQQLLEQQLDIDDEEYDQKQLVPITKTTQLHTTQPFIFTTTVVPTKLLTPLDQTQAYIRTKHFSGHFYLRLLNIPQNNLDQLSTIANMTLLLHGPGYFASASSLTCWVNRIKVPVVAVDVQTHSIVRVELTEHVLKSIKKRQELRFLCGNGSEDGIIINHYGYSSSQLRTILPTLEYRITPTNPNGVKWIGYIDPIEMDPATIQDDRPPHFFETISILILAAIVISIITVATIIILLFILCVIKIGVSCNNETCISFDQRVAKNCCCYPCRSHVSTTDATDALLIFHDTQYEY